MICFFWHEKLTFFDKLHSLFLASSLPLLLLALAPVWAGVTAVSTGVPLLLLLLAPAILLILGHRHILQVDSKLSGVLA